MQQGRALICLWVRRPAIGAPDEGRTDWFTGGADRATGLWPASGEPPGGE